MSYENIHSSIPVKHEGVTQVNFFIKDVNNLQIGEGNQMFCPENHSRESYSESNSESDTLSEEQDAEVMNCKINLDEELIEKLSMAMSTKWSQYGECLLQEEELDDIYDSFHEKGLQKMAYHILLTWSKKRKNPTIQDLANIFEDDDSDDDKKVMLYNTIIKKPKQHAITAPASSQQFAISPSNASRAIMPQ